MKIRYRIALIIIFFAYLLPIVIMGFLVHYRISDRQLALQQYLRNQVDVDRRILDLRNYIQAEHLKIMELHLRSRNDPAVQKELQAGITELSNTIHDFIQKYEQTNVASNRPFLIQILMETQEENLVEEEKEMLRRIRKQGDFFIAELTHSVIAQEATFPAIIPTIVGVSKERVKMYEELNMLADVRYIFAQRVIFSISGENERQQGFFNTIFVLLGAGVVVTALSTIFFIHRPISDIMAFLRDMRDGKRGQRLYFSSLITEIKESEEIINQFVAKAEEHEKHSGN